MNPSSWHDTIKISTLHTGELNPLTPPVLPEADVPHATDTALNGQPNKDDYRAALIERDDINATTTGLEAFREAGLVDGKTYELHKNEPLKNLTGPLPFKETWVQQKFTGWLGDYHLSFSDKSILSFIKKVQELYYHHVTHINKKGRSCPKELGMEKSQEILCKIAPHLTSVIKAADASHIEAYEGDADYVIDLQKSTPRFEHARIHAPSLERSVICAIIHRHHSSLNFEVHHGLHIMKVDTFEQLINYILRQNVGYGEIPYPITQITIVNDVIPSLKGYTLAEFTQPSLSSLIYDVVEWHMVRSKHFIFFMEDLSRKYIFQAIPSWEDYLDQLNPVINVSHTKLKISMIDGKNERIKDWERVLCFKKFDLILMYKTLSSHRTTSQQVEFDMLPAINGQDYVLLNGNAQDLFDMYFGAITFLNPEQTSFSDWIHNLWRITEGEVETQPTTRIVLKDRILNFCDHPACPQSIQHIASNLKERINKNNFLQSHTTSASKAFCFLFNCSYDLRDDLSFHDMAVLWKSLSESYDSMPEGPLKTAARLIKDKTLPFNVVYSILHISAYQALTSTPCSSSSKHFKASLTALTTNSSLRLHVENSILHFPKSPLKSFQTVAAYYTHLLETKSNAALSMKGLIESLRLAEPAEVNASSCFYTMGTPVKMSEFAHEGEILLATKTPVLAAQGFKLLLDCLAIEPSPQVWQTTLRYLPSVLGDSKNNPASLHFIELLKKHLPSYQKAGDITHHAFLNKFLDTCVQSPLSIDSYVKALGIGKK